MAKHIRHTGSFESTAAATSYTDVAGAYMDLTATHAQFGAKGPGSIGLKLRTVLAGVALTVLTFTSAGVATFLENVNMSSGKTFAAQAITATSLTYTTKITSSTTANGSTLVDTGAEFFANTTYGASIGGLGTANDVTLFNRAGVAVLGVLANTANLSASGSFTATRLIGGTTVPSATAYLVVGDGTDVQPTYGFSPITQVLGIVSSVASANTSSAYLHAHFQAKQTVATTGSIQGVEAWTWCSHTSGTVVGSYGLIANLTQSGVGGTITTAYGVGAGGVVSGGTITNWRHLNGGNFTVTGASSVVTNSYAVYVSNPSVVSSGTLTNLYGLYIAGLTAGATLNYAIYTNAGRVHFGGAVDTAGALSFSGDGTSAAGAMLKTAASGLVLRGVTGSTNDFEIRAADDSVALHMSAGNKHLVADGNFVVTGAFGCNTQAGQGAYASGGALNAYGAGANGLDSGANMSALHALVVSMRAALVANGIMS